MSTVSENESGNGAPEKKARWRKLDRAIAGLFATSLLISLTLLGWPMITQEVGQVFAGRGASAEAGAATSAVTNTPIQSPTATVTPTSSPTPVPLPLGVSGNSLVEHHFVLSMTEAGYAHLFSYSLQTQRFQRLTSGNWDDIHPALTEDGRWLAYASHQNGAWDLFVMDLQSGRIEQITQDKAYDGSPSWAPDGGWLAYEHYEDGKLEIFIQPQDSSVEPVQISTNGGVYFSPSWSPVDQRIALFIDREGRQELWIVDLERTGEERFRFVADGARLGGANWAPDGSGLAWSAWQEGQWRIYVQDLDRGEQREIGAGEQPAWGPDGQFLLAVVGDAAAPYLTAYTLDGNLALAPVALPGQVEGLRWAVGGWLDELPASLADTAEATVEAGWEAGGPSAGKERYGLASLEGVNAPYPVLNELVIPAFAALRLGAAEALGWDALAYLDDAFWPLNQAPGPGRERDWLFTGRAFSLDESLLEAGWMQVVKEEINGEVFWRVYLRTAVPDGSQGRPLRLRPWDFTARVSGADIDFQNGGRLAESVPEGYWVDFTALAQRYGWERRPALSNWRSYYPGALFGEFVLRDSLNWGEAMLQLYTPEQLSAGR